MARLSEQRGRKGSGAKLGYDFVHVAVDDHSRVAYAEVHRDETGATAAAFLHRAHAWFAQRGVIVERVLTDNGACYVSKAFKAQAQALHVVAKRTQPRRPQTNGKVERFNLTLKREWAWQRPYDSSDQRTQSLAPFLHRYNHHRPHHALKGGTPMSRLNNLPGNHS